jgi:hypothetical protein
VLPPDRTAELVTSVVDLLVELYRPPTGNEPSAARDDPGLRAAIARLHRLEGALEDLAAEARPARRLPPSVPSAGSCDRGEWVEAGMRH